MSEVSQTLEQIQRTFEEFKSANDARLNDVARKGDVDVLVTGKVDAINTELSRLSDQLKEMEKKANRVVGADGSTPEQKAKMDAFGLLVKSGNEAEYKTISAGTAAEGGYAVPEQIDRTIEKMERDASVIRQLAGQISVSTSDYKKLVDINGTASGWVAETAARTATATPGLAEVAPTMGDVYANATATQLSLDDVFFNVEQWIAESVSEEFALAENIAFISGNGTNKPTGFTTGTPVTTADASRAFGVLQYTAGGQAAAVPTTLTPYTNLIYSLRAPYRSGASFVTNNAVINSMRTIVDSTGQYLWQPSVQMGQPDRFFGYPVYADENMPAVAAGAMSAAFGNFKRGYLIVDRLGTRMLRDPYTNKPHVQFYFTKRVGGKVVNSDAIKLLKIAAS